MKWFINALSLLLLSVPLVVNAAVSCNVASSGMAFGNYDVSSPVNTVTLSVVDITCSDIGGSGSLNVTISVAISASAISKSVNDRQMALMGGADVLHYNIYRDAGLTQIWGATPGVDDLVLPRLRVPNNGSASTSVTMYGSVPAGQDVTAGSYSDSNILTINY